MLDIFHREVSPGDIVAVYINYIPLIGVIEHNSLTVAIFVREDTVGTTLIIPVIPITDRVKKLKLAKVLFWGECIKIDDVAKLINWQATMLPSTANIITYFSEKIKGGYLPDEIHSTAGSNSN